MVLLVSWLHDRLDNKGSVVCFFAGRACHCCPPSILFSGMFNYWHAQLYV